MAVPFSNRTAEITIPELALKDLPRLSSNCKEILEDFSSQLPNLKDYVECLLWLSNDKVRVTCRSEMKLEEFLHLGLRFRSQPLNIVPQQTAAGPIRTRVTVLRLAYGIPNAQLEQALSPFGEIIKSSIDIHQGIYVGSRSVVMHITKPIPSQLSIRGHKCLVFYRGQVRTCFRCGESGHQSSACPKRKGGGPFRPTPSSTPRVFR